MTVTPHDRKAALVAAAMLFPVALMVSASPASAQTGSDAIRHSSVDQAARASAKGYPFLASSKRCNRWAAKYPFLSSSERCTRWAPKYPFLASSQRRIR